MEKEIRCCTGAYELTIDIVDSKLTFEAYSELTGKQFHGELTNDTLPPQLKFAYKECKVLYALIAQAAEEKGVSLSDVGELKFTFALKMGARMFFLSVMCSYSFRKLDN